MRFVVIVLPLTSTYLYVLKPSQIMTKLPYRLLLFLPKQTPVPGKLNPVIIILLSGRLLYHVCKLAIKAS